MDRYMNASDGLPIIVSGSSYEAFLEIVIPWSYGGRDAFGEKYENAHKNVLEIGENSPEWSEKKSEAIWRGRLGVLWDVQREAGCIFRVITLNNARTIRKAGMRTMREGPGGVRKVDLRCATKGCNL